MPSQQQGVMVAPVRLLTALVLKRPRWAFTMIEHAPTSGLHAVVSSKQSLEISPG